AALARLAQAGAVLHNWAALACELMGDWQSPFAARIGPLLMEHSPYGALGVPAPEG
ncbi:MAG: hypothetical protein JO048_12660, partial [Methylobacteriaceae bacterium]|nr:hypothetical protein [Methylobacteriaceae bacterium]